MYGLGRLNRALQEVGFEVSCVSSAEKIHAWCKHRNHFAPPVKPHARMYTRPCFLLQHGCMVRKKNNEETSRLFHTHSIHLKMKSVCGVEEDKVYVSYLKVYQILASFSSPDRLHDKVWMLSVSEIAWSEPHA